MVRRGPGLTSFFILALGVLAWSAHGQQGGDIEAQILYAFHAEDANQLTALIQTLDAQARAGGDDAALRYHLAHAQYRLGLLSSGVQGAAAEPAFAQCIDRLKPLLEQNPDSVEVLSLESACYANIAAYRRVDGVLLRALAADRLNAAYKLAPSNPRVLYLRAIDELERAKPSAADLRLGYADLERAAELFEGSSATQPDAPRWGHADAYLEMGRQRAARGDVLGARNWIEKSLIAAPDFKAAQRQLAALVRR